MDLHFHHVKSLQEEIQLQKHISSLQTQIRAQREEKRIFENAQDSRNAKIFEPITNRMTSIEDAVKSMHRPLPTPPPPPPPPSLSPATPPPPVKKEEEEEEEEDKFSTPQSTPVKKRPKETGQYAGSPRSVQQWANVHQLIAKIPDGQRDDGTFGLNWKHKSIGGMPFTLTSKGVQVTTGPNQVKDIKIKHFDTWKLLFYQNPEDKNIVLKSNGRDTPAVEEYRNIVRELNLVDIVEKTSNPKNKANYQKRKKFTTFFLKNVKGTGLLFSYKKPSSFPGSSHEKSGKGLKSGFFPPNTVVIPSENKELLIKLATSLSERDAGNSSLQNLIVALAREARRRKILSKSTFNRVKSLNVMYA